MYTKNIKLEEVTVEEFEQMERHWGKNRKKHNNVVYAKIINPIVQEDTDYFELLNELTGHDYAHMLAVKRGSYWVKKLVDDLSMSGIADLARTAANDRYKDNFLEVKFSSRPELGYNDRNMAQIEFREHEGKIIGYQISTPKFLEKIFNTIVTNDNHHLVHGIWVPN